MLLERPKRAFIHVRKKKVGTKKYKININTSARTGKRSKKKLKKRNSAIKKIEPGKPKKTRQFTNEIRNSLGHKKFIPLISVINRVLKRRFIASTSRKELVDNRAWLINIQKLASMSGDWPLITHIVSQCISTTVEYATNFFKSV